MVTSAHNPLTTPPQVKALEEKNLSMRDWTLMGEADAKKRPANSLLEVHLDYDHATKQTPVVTQEMTERCADGVALCAHFGGSLGRGGGAAPLHIMCRVSMEWRS